MHTETVCICVVDHARVDALELGRGCCCCCRVSSLSSYRGSHSASLPRKTSSTRSPSLLTEFQFTPNPSSSVLCHNAIINDHHHSFPSWSWWLAGNASTHHPSIHSCSMRSTVLFINSARLPVSVYQQQQQQTHIQKLHSIRKLNGSLPPGWPSNMLIAVKLTIIPFPWYTQRSAPGWMGGWTVGRTNKTDVMNIATTRLTD